MSSRGNVKGLTPKPALKIAVLSTTFLPDLGGIQILLDWQMKSFEENFDLLRRDFNIQSVMILLPKRFETSPKEICGPFARKYFDFTPNLWGFLRARWQIRRILRENEINVIHGHNVAIDGLLASYHRGTRGAVKVLTSHGGDIASMPEFDFGLQRTIRGRMATKLALTNTDKLVAVGQAVKNLALAFFPEEDIKVIRPMFLQEREPRYLSNKSSNLPHIDAGDLVVLTLGGSRKIKGHRNLLLAFEQFSRNRVRTKLVIGAAGPEIEEIRALARQLGVEQKVFFIGNVFGSEKDAWFQRADIYANTSFFEAFGLTSLESIASDTAVLASNVGGLSETFTHLQDGFLVDPYSPSSICDGLKYLAIAKNRSRLTKQAKEVLIRHQPLNFLIDHLELYSNAVEAASSALLPTLGPGRIFRQTRSQQNPGLG